MTRKRGRALIINNMNFDKRPELCRKGSDVDVKNLSTMLETLKFDVVRHTDLKAEVCFVAVYLSSYKLTSLLVYRCIRNLYTEYSVWVYRCKAGFTGVRVYRCKARCTGVRPGLQV